jgi:hypothetical protein
LSSGSLKGATAAAITVLVGAVITANLCALVITQIISIA